MGRWVARWRAEGEAGLADRSSRPHRVRRPTPDAIAERIAALRRQRWTGRQIAAEVGVSPASVSRILRRLGLNRLAALEPAEPVRRCERGAAGRADPYQISRSSGGSSASAPHHRSQGTHHQPGHRLGVRACVHRRRLAGRLAPAKIRLRAAQRDLCKRVAFCAEVSTRRWGAGISAGWRPGAAVESGGSVVLCPGGYRVRTSTRRRLRARQSRSRWAALRARPR